MCLLVNETKNSQTLIVVDRYLRLMGDKTIPDSAEPRLESFYPPFVAGIDLPHQAVVDSYNLYNGKFHALKAVFYIEKGHAWYNLLMTCKPSRPGLGESHT